MPYCSDSFDAEGGPDLRHACGEGSKLDPELAHYQKMQRSTREQIIAVVVHAESLSGVKNLIESLQEDAIRFARSQEPYDQGIYLKIVDILDALETILHIEVKAPGLDVKALGKARRKLLKYIVAWKVPRHLIANSIDTQLKADGFENNKALKRTLSEALRRYQDARNHLVNKNERLVYSIARRYRFLGVSFDDLVQEGHIALIKAVERYAPEKGFRFSTYAYTAISQHLHTIIEQQSTIVRKPYNQLRNQALIDKSRARLEQRLLRLPRRSELEACIVDKVDIKNDYLQCYLHPTADFDPLLFTPAGIENHQAMDPAVQEEQIQYLLRIKMLEGALRQLDKRKRTIIRMRFGIGIARTYTLKEISEILFISTERVRQLSIQAETELQENYQRSIGSS